MPSPYSIPIFYCINLTTSRLGHHLIGESAGGVRNQPLTRQTIEDGRSLSNNHLLYCRTTAKRDP